ncbi:glutamine-hydrolyzing carbamoyl-phosphate synthase small subunit [Candidatus Micrarchaeota archaeon]|nr:glutamine-hydrolyzing carbamoyl-phosphate synthase small subunit [Candidatus Micrarchaeota archaeon]
MGENSKNAVLILKDGSIVHGKGFGAEGIRTGELVFSTAMQGYQESLTDPSYAGQILISTYPLIGNYGISDYAFESKRMHAEGYIVREACNSPEHMDSKMDLDSFLKEQGKPGMQGVDTRSLVLKLRNYGVMPALICVSKEQVNVAELLKNLKFDYENIDFISNITVQKPEEYGEGEKTVVLIDYGAKRNIITELVKRKLRVVVMPSFATAEEIKTFEPDGIMLSNGPGNPAILTHAHKVINELKDLPIFGICLGNQLIAHAFGGDTFKLKFGHRGVNQPVINLKDGRVRITTQNHGFAVGKIPKKFLVSEKNANDGSVEGLDYDDGHIFSVQYHPEATPGPHDNVHLFDRFVKIMR